MRLENPHSLSYQATTLTNLPNTLVWVVSKIADAGLWLKSQETKGSSLICKIRLFALRTISLTSSTRRFALCSKC